MVPDPNTQQAQRLWPRWFIAGTKPVKVDLGPAGSGPLVDISGGGFRVQSLAPLRRGAEVPVRIEIPDRREGLQCSGVVVWSKPNGAAGVRFAGLNDHQKAILHAWLSELEQVATGPSHSHVQDEFTSVVSQIRGAQLNNADALNLIVRRAKELNAVSGVAIALGTAESMVSMAAVGEAPQVGSNIPAVIGLTGECVFKRKMVHCEDSKNDPRVGRDSAFGSAVVLPLLVNNEVRGVVQAFSKRSYAFAAISIDALEKLADAVVFVTYGIVTQRRLATAKSSIPAASSTVGPKPSSTLSPMTANWSAPAAAPATTSSVRTSEFASTGTRPAYEPVPVGSTNAMASAAITSSQPVKFEPEPIASIAEPIAAPIRRPVLLDRPMAPARAATATVSPRRQPAASSESSSSGKWLGIAAVLVVSVAGGWFYFSHHRQPATSETERQVASSQATSELQTTPETVKSEPVSPSAQSAQKPAATTIAAPHASAPVAHAAQTAKHEEKRETETPTPAAPEPIVLSASAAKGPKPVDLDTVVPVKLPSTMATEANATAIALPAVSASAPKLAAELNTVRTPAMLVKRVNPVYPPMAKSARMQGTVELLIQIGKNGSVTQVKRLSGQPILAGAATEAVKQWRYDPAKVNGQPVETETTVKLTFDLYH